MFKTFPYLISMANVFELNDPGDKKDVVCNQLKEVQNVKSRYALLVCAMLH